MTVDEQLKKVLEEINGGPPKRKALRPIEQPRRFDKYGYVLVWAGTHPNRNSKNTIFEHRIVMEKKIGRYLKPEEVVHHIDGNISNNDPDNLMLFGTSGEHVKFEFQQKRQKRALQVA